MEDGQFSLTQLLGAVISSGVLSTLVTYWTSRKQNNAAVEQTNATVDETIRVTYGEMIKDHRTQIGFLQEQIVTALKREQEYLGLLSQANSLTKSLQAELSALQVSIKNLEATKAKYEHKLQTYEDIAKRPETRQGV
jgi:K+-sensing histidine kinase KdpD